ncbi:MAG TPA: M56 family metallopeptidase [Thermoanaerobaculia bacterium]
MNELGASVANFVINAAWQGSVLVLLVLACDRALHRASGRLRHAVLSAGLLAALSVPLMSGFESTRPAFFRTTTLPTATKPQEVPAAPLSIASVRVSSPAAANAIAIAYFAFVLFAGCRLMHAVRFARRLRNSATQTEGLIGFSREVTAPATVGILRPLILLPALRPVPAHALIPAVAHELAHVRRRDPLIQLAIEVVAIFVGFNPLVQLLKARIARAREIACDEIVVGAMDPLRYARALITVAQTVASPRCALAFGEAGDLAERLRSLRSIAAGRRAPRLGALAFIALAVVAIALTGCRLRMFGQEADLSGRWVLNRQQSNFGAIVPYQSFSQSIEQQRKNIKTFQVRQRRGAIESMTWSVNADGVKRPVRINGMPGEVVGRWSRGRLLLELSMANGHFETNTASLANGGKNLVCEGTVQERNRGRTRFRLVFDRVAGRS